MNKLSKEEINGYLDAVTDQIFSNTKRTLYYGGLNNSQRTILKVNLLSRRDSGEIDDNTYKQLNSSIEVL